MAKILTIIINSVKWPSNYKCHNKVILVMYNMSQITCIMIKMNSLQGVVKVPTGGNSLLLKSAS